VDVFFYTRLGPVGIPVPDRLVDLRALLEGVVTAAGDEDGLAVVFFIWFLSRSVTSTAGWFGQAA